MITIAIPCDVLNSMKIPRSDQEHVLKLELALALYQRGILAMGPARRLADISKREFLGELGKRKIERHYTVDELVEDVAFAKGVQSHGHGYNRHSAKSKVRRRDSFAQT
jgi:predicted HTH domain antitoxin